MSEADKRRLMMIHLVRDRDTIQAAFDQLEPDMFDAATEYLDQVFWRVSQEYFREHHAPIPRLFFEYGVLGLLKDEYMSLVSIDLDGVVREIDELYRANEADLNFRAVSSYLEEFIFERSQSEVLAEIRTGDRVKSYSELISELYTGIGSVSFRDVRHEDVVATGFDIFESSNRVLTGCTPIDTLMGGITYGQAIGLLGPMKGGKTSLCHSLACDFIKMYPDEKVTFITYEESARQQLPKLYISWLNKWHRDELEGKRFADMKPEIQAELQKAQASISNSLYLIDMSGAVDGQGFGGIKELETALTTRMHQGRVGKLVIVDHVLPLVTNYMNAKNIDLASGMRHQVQETANRFRNLMERLGTCGFIAHQMDAKGNQKPTRIPSHMDAAECKLFAQYLQHTLALGTRDPENDVAWLNLSATRSGHPHAIPVKINGWKCRVETVEGYEANERQKGFTHVSSYSGKYAKVDNDETSGCSTNCIDNGGASVTDIAAGRVQES